MPSLPLAVLAAVGVLVPVSGAVALDPRIEQSRAELGGARDTAAAAAAALDHAAASHEEALPTSRPLTIEQQQTPRTSRQHLRLETIDRAVLSDDVRDALHQLELVNQVPPTSAQKVERAVRVAGRVRQR